MHQKTSFYTILQKSIDEIEILRDQCQNLIYNFLSLQNRENLNLTKIKKFFYHSLPTETERCETVQHFWKMLNALNYCYRLSYPEKQGSDRISLIIDTDC